MESLFPDRYPRHNEPKAEDEMGVDLGEIATQAAQKGNALSRHIPDNYSDRLGNRIEQIRVDVSRLLNTLEAVIL